MCDSWKHVGLLVPTFSLLQRCIVNASFSHQSQKDLQIVCTGKSYSRDLSIRHLAVANYAVTANVWVSGSQRESVTYRITLAPEVWHLTSRVIMRPLPAAAALCISLRPSVLRTGF